MADRHDAIDALPILICRQVIGEVAQRMLGCFTLRRAPGCGD
jgi:hypothetical protein